MPTLNIIGAGKVARVLGRLWHESGRFRIADVVTSGPRTAAEAAAFIGAGRPLASLETLQPAACWMVGVNDDAIAAVAGRLAAIDVVRAGDLVFHLSGALAAEALSPLGASGAVLASVHPLKSIAEPLAAYRSFAGTPVALEGDADACATLAADLEVIGALTFRLASEQKLRYHAATSISCNLLNALLDVALEVYQRAGIEPTAAARMVAPLLTESLANALERGPAASLTGPIARGDAAVVAAHLAALPDSLRGVYLELGRRALAMATAAGRLTPAQHDRLAAVLDPSA